MTDGLTRQPVWLLLSGNSESTHCSPPCCNKGNISQLSPSFFHWPILQNHPQQTLAASQGSCIQLTLKESCTIHNSMSIMNCAFERNQRERRA